MNDTLGFRRTALLLHAMSAADRNWMLAKLGGDVQTTLSGMLNELRALGIPGDQALLNRAAQSTASVGRASVSSDTSINAKLKSDANDLQAGALESEIASLTHAAPAALAQILSEEPPELIARLLTCHAWEWRDDVLEKLGSRRRLQVERLAHSFPACPTRLREVLLQSVAARVAYLTVPKQGQKQSHTMKNDATVKPVRRINKILMAFKLHGQFSSLRRGAK